MFSESRILCATDFSGTSAEALPLALALATKQEAAATLLHVIEPFPDVTARYGSAQHIVRAATCPVLTARPLQHVQPVSRDEAAAPHLAATASGS